MIVICLYLGDSVGYSAVHRISSVHKDLGQSQKIYLHAGLISVIEFPQNIIEVRLGNPKSLKAQLSQVSPRELTLFLSQQAVEPTNLIVKSEKRFFVFDIIPSKTSHQDYIKIAAAFSGPTLSEVGMPTITRDLSAKKSTKPQGHLVEAIKMGGE